MTIDDRIRSVLDGHARLREPATAVDATADLYAAGMTSHASVNVMLALEDAFDIEFPDDLLAKQTFTTIATIRDAVAQLTLEGQTA
jgi:acyl carrier protein